MQSDGRYFGKKTFHAESHLPLTFIVVLSMPRSMRLALPALDRQEDPRGWGSFAPPLALGARAGEAAGGGARVRPLHPRPGTGRPAWILVRS
jgi:hypothetical protein